jgi:uncharacterized cupredoxin-like copper-binding protein
VIIAATEINAFHVVGALTAVWAVLVAVIGITRHNFPGSDAQEKAVMAISALLVIGSIGTGIATSASAEGEHGGSGEAEATDQVNKGGEEGSSAPDQGGTPAPDTEPEGGQEPGASGQNAPPGKTVQTLKLNADPDNDLVFNTDQLEAKAGHVRLTMTNPAQIDHDVSLEGPGGVDEHGEAVGEGGASEVEADVEPGSYTFYCSLPGHREAGMEGTLTVK